MGGERGGQERTVRARSGRGPRGARRAEEDGAADLGSHGRGGFVLAFVVFMLFSVSVAAATGYLVINSEFAMSKNAIDGSEALAVARAGLERFVAEQLGVVADTVSYALGDGVAVVTTRRLFTRDAVTDMYYIRSEATVTDIFAPDTPARRVVGAYAVHRRRPLVPHAVVMLSADLIRVESGGWAHGTDYSTPSDCPVGGASDIGGLVTKSSFFEDVPTRVEGSPEAQTWAGGYSAIVDSIAIRWDVLSDPDLPLEFDGVWPNYGTLPSDSFPVVRQYGWVAPNTYGRGVLIVDGVFDPGPSFQWYGIVLAGVVDDVIQGSLRGLLVGGLDANNPYTTVSVQTDVRYYSCEVYAANESLSYLELLENTVFESN
jgi:hypothetical protein